MSGEAPEGWSVKPLGEIADLIMGQSPPSSAVAETGDGLPFIQGNAEFGARHPTPRFIASTTPKVVREGDILISVRAPVGEVNIAEGPLCIGRGVGGIRAKECDPDFLFYAVGGLSQTFARLSQGSTFDAINGKELRSIEILFPPLDEQRRIAEVLRSVDEAHRLNGLALSHLRLLRKLALRDLFTATDGEEFEDTILGPLPRGWAAIPAEEVCEAVIDCKNRTPPITETGFAVVRTPNVRDGRFVRHNLVRTDPNSFEEWTRRGRPKAGDVLITREAPIGEVCAVPDDEPICLGQRMMLYRPNPTKLDSSFLLYALQSEPVQDHLRNLGGGSTVGHVRVGDIRRLPIPCPPISTQIAVAEMLGDIDVALDRAAGSFAQTVGLKNSLASDLLSGRVRVPA